MKQIDLASLRRHVAYDKDTGVFTRIVATGKGGRHKAGAVLGHEHGNGYLMVHVCGCRYYAHRLAWMYVYGEWPKQHIDHINGITRDNRIANLRDAPQQINRQNRCVASRRSKLGVLGVYFDNTRNKYVAQIVAGDGHRISKRFASVQEAELFYKRMKAMVHAGYVPDRVVKNEAVRTVRPTKWTA